MKVETLIELMDPRPLENVLGVEVCRPERVIYVCPEGEAARKRILRQLRTYFEHRGIQTDLSIVYADVYNTRAMVERFRSLFQDHPGCVVDITGGTDAVLFACGLACEGTQISAITYSRRNNRFYEIRNADYANQLNCAISFSVEDTFLMAGGRLKKGRVDNAGLSRYLDLIDPFFQVYLNYRGAWDRIVMWMQRASAADEEGRYSLEVDTPYTVKGERGNRIHASEKVLRDLAGLDMIQDLQIIPEERVCFQFKDDQIRTWLRDVGSVLELYTYKACLDTQLFDDVISSAVVEWDNGAQAGQVSNELDVMCTRGIVPLFISCKTCMIRTEALNELAVLRDRFGGEIAKAAIVSAEHVRAVTRNRAADLNIRVIDLEDLKTGLLGKRIRNLVADRKGNMV